MSDVTCSVEGCERPVEVRAMCWSHVDEWLVRRRRSGPYGATNKGWLGDDCGYDDVRVLS
jgi:hypothetical protein